MEITKAKNLGIALIAGLMINLMVPSTADAQPRVRTRTVKTHRPVQKTRVVRTNNSLPRRGSYVRTAPASCRVVRYGSVSYRYANGVFYRPMNNQFVVAAPPVGIRVNALPRACNRFVVGPRTYYYYYGTYYAPAGYGQYQVVNPPLGAQIDTLPAGYEIFEIDGFVYYKVGLTYYKAVALNNGLVLYEVVRTA